MRSFSVNLGWTVVALGAIALRAQEDTGNQSIQATDTYVNDSFEAEEMLSRIERHATRGEWLAAAKLADDAFEDFIDRLARTRQGCYESMTERLNTVIASWPERGRAAFDDRVSPRAEKSLADAVKRRDLDRLLVLFDHYNNTRVAIDIAEAASELAMECGDFATARRICQDLLERRHRVEARETRFMGRLAVIAALDGHEDEANRWLSHFGEQSTTGMIRWLGEEVPLTSLVRSVSSDVRAHERDDVEHWPIFGGNGGRNGAGSFVFDRVAPLWRFDKFGPGTLDGMPAESDSHVAREALESGKFLVFNPVADKTLIFFQDANDIWAIQANTGTKVWHHGSSAPDDSRFGGADGSTAEWFSPTINGDRLFACIGSETVPYYGYETALPMAAVICLNTATGELIWRTNGPESNRDSSRMRFGSSPVVTEDSVYVVVRKRRTVGFEDCYLVRLRAADGTRVYETHLGSASVGGFGYRRSTLSIPAYHDGELYVATNLGTVAAVTARTGRVNWLRLYPREAEAEWRDSVRSSARDVQPWHFNPILVSGDRLILRPSDAPVVMVLKRSDGEVLHSLDAERLGGAATLLGMQGTHLFVLGDAIHCVDTKTGETRWSSSLPTGQSPFGRGILAGGRALVPTDRGLCGFDLEDGSLIKQSWDGRGSAGNLLAMPERLIVAGYNHITTYGRKADVWNRLRGLMSERPDDPSPALDLAEVAYRSGARDEALSLLEQAVERGGGFAEMTDEVRRARLFNDCIWFAGDWIIETDEDRAVRVDLLYEFAGQCAPDRQGHLAYRFRFAEHLLEGGDLARAIDLYHQILSDRSLRESDWGGAESRMTAGDLAKNEIAEILSQFGRGAYAMYDAEAADWLIAARRSGDATLLDRILQTRPLAETVPQAMLEKAEWLRRDGEALAAASLLEAAFSRHEGQLAGADVIRRIADCYADAGNAEIAWQWMTKAVGLYPRERVSVAGELVSVHVYRERFSAGRDAAHVRRPRIGGALKQSFERSFNFEIAILKPVLDTGSKTRWDGMYTFGDGKLFALNPVTGEFTWPAPKSMVRRPALLFAVDRRLVLATGQKLTALDADSGEELWSAGHEPSALDDVAVDPESIASFFGYAVYRNRLFSIMEDGRAVCIEVAAGETLWQQSLRHRPTSQPVFRDQWIAYRGRVRGVSTYCILNARTGALRSVIDVDAEHQLLRLHLTADGKLVVVLSQSIEAYDADSGQRIWRRVIDGKVIDSTVSFDLDGVFLSEGSSRLTKIRLCDGVREWESEPQLAVGMQSAQTTVADREVLVLSAHGVTGIDAIDGRTLWHGEDNGGVDYAYRFFTESHVLAIESPGNEEDGEFVAHVFDSGAGPFERDSHSIKLGSLPGLRDLAVRDGAIVAQLAGGRLMGWSSGP